MAKFKILQQKGEDIYPITHPSAVIDENGRTVEERLNSISAKPSAFAIAPNMYDLDYTSEEAAVSPFDTRYKYVSITIHEDAGVEWVEGGIYTIVVAGKEWKIEDGNRRNGRVRIGENGTWYPIATAATNQIITAYNIIQSNQTSVMVFKKNYFPDGALHVVYDTNPSLMPQAELEAGTVSTGRSISAKLLNDTYGKRISSLETKMNEIYEDYTNADSLL